MLIDEEKREDSMFRIVKCCGNCEHSSYFKGKQRRLVCIHGIKPDPRKVGKPSPNRKDNHLEKFYKKNMYDRFPATHVTAVCDFHKWSSKGTKSVTEWCGAERMEEY